MFTMNWMASGEYKRTANLLCSTVVFAVIVSHERVCLCSPCASQINAFAAVVTNTTVLIFHINVLAWAMHSYVRYIGSGNGAFKVFILAKTFYVLAV